MLSIIRGIFTFCFYAYLTPLLAQSLLTPDAISNTWGLFTPTNPTSKDFAKPLLQDFLQQRSSDKDLVVVANKVDEDNKKVFEIQAHSFKVRNNISIADGSASFMNAELFAFADKIIYNGNTSQVRLQGNVIIYKSGNIYLQAREASFYLNSSYIVVQPFYVQESQSGIWMDARAASEQNDLFKFSSSIVSGCSVDSPAWRIDASSGSFDKKKSIVSLFNTKVYIGDVPVFYSPYLRFSTITKRTSGFLYPTTGQSSTDGFVYIQPYYLALQDFWDMTFSPQYRTSRGFGLNYEFRMANPYGDALILHTKYFHNNEDYVRSLNLLNSEIFGFDFKYSSYSFLQKYFGVKSSIDNGLYVDFMYMNDLDYQRIDALKYYLNNSSYTSRMNLYMQDKGHYAGINLKYFLNLSTPDNSKTFQNLPNLQYHKYLSTLYYERLLYSFDYSFKNVYRDSGYGYVSNELFMPVGLQISLFDNYLSIGAYSNFYAGNIYSYNNSKTEFFTSSSSIASSNTLGSSGNYLKALYRISLNTDLGKSYKSFFHSFQAAAVFQGPMPYSTFTNGVLSSNLINAYTIASSNEEILRQIEQGDDIWDPSSFSSIILARNRVDINMSNYFYGRNGKELFYWRVNQILNLDDNISPARIPMENKLGISPIKGLNLSTSFFYSIFFNAITELALNASYSSDYVNLSASYFLRRNTSFSVDNLTLTRTITDATNFLRFDLRGDLGYFGLAGNIAYDFNTNTILNLGVGIFKDIKCFGIGFKVGSDRTPILVQASSSQANSISIIQNNYVKFEIKFVPLTGIGYTYRLRPTIAPASQSQEDGS